MGTLAQMLSSSKATEDRRKQFQDPAYARDLVAKLMKPDEVVEAQRMVRDWRPSPQIGAPPDLPSLRTASGAPSSTPGKLRKMGTGTLFLVNAKGQAITNHHVVAGCGEIRIDGREGLAKVVTEDAVNDLALVQIPGDAKATAAIASEPGKLRQGEDIVVFGFPLNAVLSSGGNLTPGVVSALTGLGNNTNQLQITAPIQPGSSGSPVLNKKGEVVGVVSMKLSDSKMAKATGSVGQNVNFAVNGQTLRTFLDTHKVDYRNGAGFFSWDKNTADLADEARKWTLVAECWK
jgi:S1-C subfamily serine protease